MNHEVPQPMTATRAPEAGNLATTSGSDARRAASRQQSGWLAISCSTKAICEVYLIEPAVRPLTTRPSITANRMMTGIVAITDPAKRWPQSTEYSPM